MSNNTTASQCTNDFPSTRQLYQELGYDVSVIILTVFVALVCIATIAIFLEEAWYLVHSLKNKSRRVKIVSILALYPVVSITSLFCLLVPTSTLLSEFAASIYLSFCIMLFVHLVIQYFGGDEEILKDLEGSSIDFNTPPCCCCCLCLRNIPFNKRSLKVIKLMVLQVSIIRPIILFTAAALWTDGYYVPAGEADPDSATLYINIINAVSTLFAIYGMMVIYRGTAQELQHVSLRMKFLSLQLAVLCLNLQSTILALIARFAIPPCSGTRGSRVRSSRFHHFCLIIEMLLLAILARFAYRRLEAERQDVEKNPEKENGENAFTDVLKSIPIVEVSQDVKANNNKERTENTSLDDVQTYL